MSNGKGSKRLKVKVIALQRDTESLLKLLGGSDDDRERFWEILKGITTPAVFHMVDSQVGALSQQVKGVSGMVKTLQKNAKGLSA
jgi:hypothetical protein